MVHHTQLLAVASLLSSLVYAVPDLVDLSYSQYRGVTLSNGISQWLGMRYAAPPLYDLRFQAPSDPPMTEDVQSAEEVRSAEDGEKQELTAYSMALIV